jgi:hypothetical protein
MSSDESSKMFNVGANTKAAKRIAIIVVSFGLLVWLGIRFTAGEKVANQAAAIVLQRPIEIKNTIENLKASSIKTFSFKVPYSGNLHMEASVLKGNDISLYLVSAEQVDQVLAKKQFKHFEQFAAEKTKNYKREARLQSGEYAFVTYDRTLGILSKASSDIKIIIDLKP